MLPQSYLSRQLLFHRICSWQIKESTFKHHTISRLELCAAVLAVNIAHVTEEHLKVKLDNIKFYSDSRVVIGFIHNETKRFFSHVANHVAYIRSLSKPSQWFYVRSEANSADTSTRGTQPSDMQNSVWLHGPGTLSSSAKESTPLTDDCHPHIDPDVD